MKRAPIPHVLEFLGRLWALDHELQSLSRRMEVGLGVTGPQRMVLRLIGLTPNISPGELAERLHVHPSTLTGRLRELVRRGLIRRVGDPDDRRRALLALTPGGRRLNAVKHGTTEAAVRRALGRVTAAEVRVAGRVFDELAAAIRDEQEA